MSDSAMSDDILRDMLAKLKPGMSQKQVLAALVDEALECKGPAVAEAFLACAVPHWFDEALLAAMLKNPSQRQPRCLHVCAATVLCASGPTEPIFTTKTHARTCWPASSKTEPDSAN
jgi:hypothetical protein